jgi:hypothetical protein
VLNADLFVQPVLETLDDMLRRLQDMSPDEKTLTQVDNGQRACVRVPV